MLPERKKWMIETRSRISAAYKGLKARMELNPALEDKLFELFTHRINDLGIRSYFTSSLYRYIKRQAETEGIVLREFPDATFDTQLALVSEGIIAVQYLENQVLDEKNGLRGCTDDSKKQMDICVLSSHYVKDTVYEYIDRSIFLDDLMLQRCVNRALRRIYRYVDAGQMFQDQWGTYDQFMKCEQKDIPISLEMDAFIHHELIQQYCSIIHAAGLGPDKNSFMRNYLRRVFLTSGALFVLIAEMEMDLLGYNGLKRDAIRNAAASIGIIGQIVNDMTDFLPVKTVSKQSIDVLSDIRNNIITPPLALFFDRNPAYSIEGLQKLIRENRLPVALAHIQTLMKPYIFQTMEIAVEMRRQSTVFFDVSHDEGRMLEDMNSVVHQEENKYLSALKDQLDSLDAKQAPYIRYNREVLVS